MYISDIKILRAAVQDVVRASALDSTPPVVSDELVVLDSAGKELVSRRLTNNIGSGAHCVEVSVDDESENSPFQLITSAIGSSDKDYILASKKLARLLSSSQTIGSIKAGSAIFLEGSCTAQGRACRFVAVIKADSDEGLYKSKKGETINLTYIHDMIFGEAQRLLKIGLFLETKGLDAEAPRPERRNTSDFIVYVFDHLMSASGNGSAATYFYKTFLRCRYANTAPRQTKHFFETTRFFINSMDVPQDERVELHNDLISYMRNQTKTILAKSFAETVLPEDARDDYLKECESKGLSAAFTKDTSLLKPRLRRQSYRFTSKVVLTGSPDALRDSVKFMESDDDEWTALKIRGSIGPLE